MTPSEGFANLTGLTDLTESAGPVRLVFIHTSALPPGYGLPPAMLMNLL
jgi:hypothetical protein